MLYRRKAVELTASLTSDEGYGNGNKMLLKRVLKGGADRGPDVDEAELARPRGPPTSLPVQGVAEGHPTFTGSLLRCIHVRNVALRSTFAADAVGRRRCHHVCYLRRLLLQMVF
jgi:hypothetical protein